jgi:hypothetical protein
MEFNDQGGIFVTDVRSRGQEWSVEVPWEVAADGWQKEAREGSPDREQLKAWLSENEGRFSNMVVARVEAVSSATHEPDDPRVLAAQTLRHI